MAYRFPLEALLRLRTTLTRQEEVRLEGLAQQLQAARQELEALQARRREFERSLNAELKRGTLGSELQLRMIGSRGLREAEQQLMRAIVVLERSWSEQREKFKEARQRQEVLENVRQGQVVIYKEEQRRREQQLIDDLFRARTAVEKAR
jgi:flagellar export protein FliJ